MSLIEVDITAKTEINKNERKNIYYALQEKIVEEAPYIWAYQAEHVTVRRDWVMNYIHNPVLLYDFYKIYIEK